MEGTVVRSDTTVKASTISTSAKNQQAQDSTKLRDNASNSHQPIHVLSIDVECVATGYTHLDRAPCSVAIVNEQCEVLFDSLIKPDQPVVSDLYPLSGVRLTDLQRAPSFDEVIKKVTDIACARSESLHIMRGDPRTLVFCRCMHFSHQQPALLGSRL